jgi:ABC-type transport system substrate-binding protein
LAGIGLNIQIKEWGKVMEQMDSRNFELLIIGVSGAPFEGDYKDSWHTSAIPAKMGRNYTGFGNAKSDKLLDEIRVTLDKAKRGELYKQLQQIVADEVPIVYLVNQKATLGVNKRFTNVYPTGLRPGFIARGFKLN